MGLISDKNPALIHYNRDNSPNSFSYGKGMGRGGGGGYMATNEWCIMCGDHWFGVESTAGGRNMILPRFLGKQKMKIQTSNFISATL